MYACKNAGENQKGEIIGAGGPGDRGGKIVDNNIIVM